MRLTEIPLLVSAIAFLIAYAWAVLGQLRGGWSVLAGAVMTLSWAIFAVDYFVRLYLAVRELTEEVRALRASLLTADPLLVGDGVVGDGATRPTWTSGVTG